ncbi:MAG: ATP-binding protein [Alphaproteobacteria bacterium]|nr:ATP-binding protein [Alphaproteobacteria bacterium]
MKADQPDSPGPPPIEGGLLERFPDPVVVVDSNRLVVAANKPARDLLPSNYFGRDLAMSLRHPNILAAIDSAFLSGIDEDCEITLPGAVPRMFDLRVFSLRNEASGRVEAVLIFRDVTSAKRSDQMRADFVANVSHELRSPLSAMIGFIETLRGPAKDDDEAQVRFLAIMQGEAERMSHLIQDLLSLSRVEVNEHIAPTSAAEVDAILKSLKEMLAPRAAERNMTIELDVSKGLPSAIGDPDQLHQVFRNLVDNAISYGKEGTPIRVGAQRIERMPRIGGPGVAVSVRDEGDGIPDEQIFRLTERFYRVDKGRSRSMGGTGLGLAIVKHIVSRHRGALAVESQVGKGSTFTVTIPAQPD